MNDEEYPYQDDWPVEGFPLNDETAHFVQIRTIKCTQAMPPYKGYPSTEERRLGKKRYKSRNNQDVVYEWWEVRLCFRPYNKEVPPPEKSKSFITMHGKSGRELKYKQFSRCIARFETQDEARLFTHKLHQSEKKKTSLLIFLIIPTPKSRH